MHRFFGPAALIATSILLTACDDLETTAVQSGGGSATALAERACVAEVQRQANRGGVTVISSDFSEAGTRVTLNVPTAQAPWTCLASNDGTVEDVSYTGSEGYL